MQCKNPIRLAGTSTADSPDDLMVPCGKCAACRVARAREWSIRVLHEMGAWNEYLFVTLTYNDTYLPKNCSISKDVLKKFFKRLRKIVKKIKYYACGEYGDKGGRPHYHAIIFGIGFKDHIVNDGLVLKGPLADAWKYGNIFVGNVTYESARYVARYIGKAYTGDKEKEVYKKLDLVTPFQLASNGLGLHYIENYCDSDTRFITFRGKKLGLPRYYKNKLNIDKSKFVEHIKDAEITEALFYMNQGYLTVSEIAEQVKKRADQRELNIIRSEEVHRKRKL